MVEREDIKSVQNMRDGEGVGEEGVRVDREVVKRERAPLNYLHRNATYSTLYCSCI